MKQFFFNLSRDLHKVDTRFAGVDLRQAYVNNAVPSGVVGAEMVYNDVEDPSGVMPHPSDQFEAMRQADHVKSALKKGASAKSEAPTSEGD